MPKRLDPNYRLRLVLAGDLDKEPQPCFWAKNLTVGMIERYQGGMTITSLVDAVMDCLVGWEHMVLDGQPLEFSRENVAMVLDADEMREIIEFCTSQARLGVEERKKSDSPH